MRVARVWWVPTTWIVCSLPLLRVIGEAMAGSESPLTKVFHRTGYWAVIWLCVTLACTPVRRLSGWTWPLRLRRTFGLCAFGYASLHTILHFAVMGAQPWIVLVQDLAARWFILFGVAAFALLVPLAATSPRRVARRLGSKRWKLLHSSHYVAAALACLHYAARGKSNAWKPQLFAALLLVFFAWRWRDTRHKSLQTQRSH